MCIAKAISRVWRVSLVAVLLTILSSKPALPQFPPPQSTNVERPTIGSGRVSLGHGDFVLKFREGMGFVLENETQGRRWPVKLLVGSENKEESLLDKAKKDHAKVDQVELARHSRDSMICVGNSHGRRRRAYCLFDKQRTIDCEGIESARRYSSKAIVETEFLPYVEL